MAERSRYEREDGVPTKEFRVRIPLSLWWLIADQARLDRRSVNAQMILALATYFDWERAPHEYGPEKIVWATDPDYVHPNANGGRPRQRHQSNWRPNPPLPSPDAETD